jgi:hypothetical protein
MARGLLAEILSRPDDWITTADAIWRRARSERGKDGEGRDAVRKAFAELAAAGYLHRERRRAGRSRFTTMVHVFDSPDGREAWLAAEAFRARAVDNSTPADVSAGRAKTGRFGIGPTWENLHQCRSHRRLIYRPSVHQASVHDRQGDDRQGDDIGQEQAP